MVAAADAFHIDRSACKSARLFVLFGGWTNDSKFAPKNLLFPGDQLCRAGEPLFGFAMSSRQYGDVGIIEFPGRYNKLFWPRAVLLVRQFQ